MCTEIKGDGVTEAKFGYKVVEIHGISTCSPIHSHDWRIGMNVARGEWNYSRVKSEGVFHFCASRDQARQVKRILTNECIFTYKIIKCELRGEMFEGVHYDTGYKIDGKKAYLATKAFWDGKFVR